jgi:hypothetical protein
LKQRSIGAIGLLLAWNAWQKQNVDKLSPYMASPSSFEILMSRKERKKAFNRRRKEDLSQIGKQKVSFLLQGGKGSEKVREGLTVYYVYL